MAIPYTSLASTANPNFTTPRTQQCWVEYPFSYANDNTSRLYHHIMVMPGDLYAPLSYNYTMTSSTYKPLGSLFSDDSNAFWVGDRNVSPIGDNLVQFDRMFARVPNSRTEGAPNYNFTFPNTGATGGFTIDHIANNYTVSFNTSNARAELHWTMTSARSADYSLNDKVRASQGGHNLRFKSDTSDVQFVQGFYVIYSKVQISGGFRFKAYYERMDIVSSIYQSSGYTSALIEKRVTFNRESNQNTLDADSLIDFRYVKTDDILSISTTEAFQIVSVDSGSRFTVVDTMTADTLPAIKTYNAIVYTNGFIQGEAESARRWMGNIWELASRRVRAQ